MAYRSGMFNSVGGDRKYQALHFAEYFATFIGNGVFPNPSNGLQVYAKENMTVTVKAGKAWINGYYFVNDSDFEIQLKVADGVLKRTDRIFLRFDIATRQIHPVVRSSGFSASPSTPQLQRDGDAYELALATINVGAGVIAITQAAIVDERLSGAVCGIVHGTVDQVDTTTLFNQYQTWLNEQKELYEQNVNQWTTDKKATFDAWLNQQADEYDDFQAQQQALFDAWFASIQNILSGDVAGNLALMITNHIDSNMHIYDATVSYVDGLYTLTTTKNIDNSYVTLRFKSPNVYQDGDKFKVGNDTYTATNVDFNENDIVMINFDKANLLACGVTSIPVQVPLPAQVNTFTATGGDKTANLAWTNSNTANLEDYLIVYKIGSIPASPTDGTRLIVAKTATSTTVTGLTNNSTYYFRIYPRNSKKQLQKTQKTASVTPIAGLLLSSLPVGTKIKDVNTKYNGATITWLVGGHNHYAQNQTALVSERIISLKAFDAIEASNTDSNRKNYGNNRYAHSNLRQWLNSAATSWYAAQHPADAPPNNENVSSNNNEYDAESGFLTNFSANLRNALQNTSLTVARNTVVDGGGTETITDKVFLLSNTEVGLANENGVAEGKLLPLFNSDASRQASLTQEAVSKSEYTNTGLKSGSPWYWWLRTPFAGNSRSSRYAGSSGALSYGDAYYGDSGVRPALNLNSTTLVSQTPDSDGAYTILW